MSEVLSRGHNNPPGLVPLLETAGLADQLRLDHHHLFVRRDELLKMVADWVADHAEGVGSEDDAKEATDTLGQVLREIDTIDKSSSVGLRAEIKKPILDATRIIDGIFKTELADQLRAGAAKLNGPLTKFAQDQRRKAEEARQKLIREQQDAEQKRQRELQEEAERANTQAAETMSAADLDAAIAAEEAALNAPHEPSPFRTKLPSTKEAGRVYGDLGTMSSLRGKWKAVIVDPRAVPREHCVPSQALIDAAMKASIPPGGKGAGSSPTITIPGVRFEFEENLSTRR
ncbi:MAG TPA: hypothetical protein VL614_15295 [Acetobacteraceae bacterium]|nr:hypothetical protein [Acetobacteraceae bacterium]